MAEAMERREGLQKKWLVFYTKSRWEKKVKGYLEKFGYQPYLPLHKVVRQWSDRKKKVVVPLFNSYIFVYDIEARIQDILKVPGIGWNIRHNGKPAVLRDEELATIKRFIESGFFLETQSAEKLTIGDRVKVVDGPLRGIEGFLSGQPENQKFTVLLENIDQVIHVNLETKLLKKLESFENQPGNSKFDKNII